MLSVSLPSARIQFQYFRHRVCTSITSAWMNCQSWWPCRRLNDRLAASRRLYPVLSITCCDICFVTQQINWHYLFVTIHFPYVSYTLWICEAGMAQSVMWLRYWLDDQGIVVQFITEESNFYLSQSGQTGSKGLRHFSLGTGFSLVRGKVAGGWSWPLTTICYQV